MTRVNAAMVCRLTGSQEAWLATKTPTARMSAGARQTGPSSNGRFCRLQSRAPDPPDLPCTVLAELTFFGRGQRSLMAVVSAAFGGFHRPLRAAGWNVAQMGQPKDNGCCYATTERLLSWFESKGVPGCQIWKSSIDGGCPKA
jgi:hypothetical protein